MRIAILGSVALPVPPPFQGGTEWIAYYQAKGLTKLGHKVILFAASGSKKDEGYEVVEVGGGDTVAGSSSSGSCHESVPTFVSSRSRVRETSKPKVQVARSPFGETQVGMPSFVPPANENIESSRSLRKENVYLAQAIQKLVDRQDDYDVILNNMRGEAVFLPFAKLQNKPFVNVMHLPIFPELADIFRKYNTHIITISNSQRKEFPDLNYLATVNNCVDTEKYTFEENGSCRSGIPNLASKSARSAGLKASEARFGKPSLASPITTTRDDRKTFQYLLMMGTIGRHKNQKDAIEVAKKTGMKLVLAGKIRDQDYYKELQKDIDGDIIRWIGELGFGEKLKLYQNAKAFIFPILWEEPFGLVMIEAMACGTPVVAYENGAVLEVVVDGVTGFVVEPEVSHLSHLSNLSNPSTSFGAGLSHLRIEKKGVEGLVEAVQRINAMSLEEYRQMRINCRKYVEENFTVEKMVKCYEEALLKVV